MADLESRFERKLEISENFGRQGKHQNQRTGFSKSPADKRGKFMVKRRPPHKAEDRPNDVYIGEKTNAQSQLQKCKLLLDGEYTDVYLHGLGIAIPSTLNVALELKKFYQGTVDFSSTTATVKLIDDLIPKDDLTAPSHKTRNVSSVTVHVFRTVKIP